LLASVSVGLDDGAMANAVMNSTHFDKSGNTGRDLRIRDDPVFVLSSCRSGTSEEEPLSRHCACRPIPQLKAGQQSVLCFLQSSQAFATAGPTS
jgi:hypothetical protein